MVHWESRKEKIVLLFDELKWQAEQGSIKRVIAIGDTLIVRHTKIKKEK